jgi:hypothetical protein
MARYNLNDRPVPGGSMEPRLNAPRTHKELNAKLGPSTWPKPLVRETSSGCVYESNAAARRRVIGLPSRFDKS